jgi:hypothetical protein
MFRLVERSKRRRGHDQPASDIVIVMVVLLLLVVCVCLLVWLVQKRCGQEEGAGGAGDKIGSH